LVNANSATQNVVITAPAGNAGAITINSCTIGGADAAAYNFNPAFAPVTIIAGASANVPVRFSPTALAPATQLASVTCTTSTATATVTGTVNLTGSVAQPVISAATAPGPLTLPGYTAGPAPGTSSSTLNFTIVNAPGMLACVATGAGYSATPSPLNMTIAGPNVVTVTYTGTVAGTFAGTLNCTSTAPATGGPFAYTLSTTVAPVGSISAALTPATLTFPSTLVAANSATQNVVISAPAGNAGSITINACTIGGANAAAYNFNPAFAPVTIIAGASANVPVRFSPTALAPATQVANVTCTTSTATATVTGTVNLTGSVAQPVISAVTAPGPITLPGYTAGPAPGTSSATLNFTVVNAPGALACVATGAGYTATPSPLNMTIAGPNVVTVTYTGTVAGTFAGTLNCTSTAPATGGPFAYTLSTTVAPVGSITAALTPATLTFASTTVGTSSATQNVVITAAAGNSASITINSCTIGGADAAAYNFNPAFAPVTLAAGAIANVPVRFSPTAAAPVTQVGSVTCTTSTATATVTGTTALTGSAAAVVGVAPTATIAASATLTAGAGAVPVTVLTTGTATATLALACTVAPGASSFAITGGANRMIAAPAALGLNAPDIGVSCTPGAATTTAIVSCAQTATPAGAALPALTSTVSCPGVTPTPITANTPPGLVTLPGYVTPGVGTSSTTLSFGIAGGNGAMNCVVSGAGYTVSPANPVPLTVAGPNVVTVTYTGAVAGTFAGGLSCTPAAPATGGPFIYTLSTTVGVPAVNTVQVPALGNISLMLLIAGFLGLGVVLVGRRQA